MALPHCPGGARTEGTSAQAQQKLTAELAAGGATQNKLSTSAAQHKRGASTTQPSTESAQGQLHGINKSSKSSIISSSAGALRACTNPLFHWAGTTPQGLHHPIILHGQLLHRSHLPLPPTTTSLGLVVPLPPNLPLLLISAEERYLDFTT